MTSPHRAYVCAYAHASTCLVRQFGYGRSGKAGCAVCPDPLINKLLLAVALLAVIALAAVSVISTLASAGSSKSLLSMMVKTVRRVPRDVCLLVSVCAGAGVVFTCDMCVMALLHRRRHARPRPRRWLLPVSAHVLPPVRTRAPSMPATTSWNTD